jgi:hypothetical protein
MICKSSGPKYYLCVDQALLKKQASKNRKFIRELTFFQK